MQKELVILDDDKRYARERIAELQQQIRDLGPEFYEVFNQSSETWHDNAPFDALRDRQSVLDAELQNLRAVLRNSVLGVPKVKRGVVNIGSRVRLSSGKSYLVAGDWTPHAGQVKNGVMVISRNTPLAAEMLSKKVADMVAIGRKEEAIVKVE